MTENLKIVDMIRTVVQPGERLHYTEVTRRVIKVFPAWIPGKTPEYSIRRDLNYFSDRHPETGEIYFHADREDGYYSVYEASGLLPDSELRVQALVEFAKHIGQQVPAAFLQHTRTHCPEAKIDQFHPLLSGIYKPKWHEAALCIKVGIDSPYPEDHVQHQVDGRWMLDYAERAGGAQVADNRALARCIELGLPVGVVLQTQKKDRGSTYLILGLGFIRSYSNGKFQIDSATNEEIRLFARTGTPILQEELALGSLVTRPFNLTEEKEVREQTVTSPVRDIAFKHLLRNYYDCRCSVCRSKFYLKRTGASPLVEVEGAHIVPVQKGGSDDPRNGLSLCKRHHWSLDRGLFSVSEEYKVIVSEEVVKADREGFNLEEFQGVPILLPVIDKAKPHQDAMAWHRENVLLR